MHNLKKIYLLKYPYLMKDMLHQKNHSLEQSILYLNMDQNL